MKSRFNLQLLLWALVGLTGLARAQGTAIGFRARGVGDPEVLTPRTSLLPNATNQRSRACREPVLPAAPTIVCLP